jgi:hypothetical protein
MQTVYKYELPLLSNDKFTLEMKKNAKIIHCDTQHDQGCIWAIIDTDEISEVRYFRRYATGEPLESYFGSPAPVGDNGGFVGTFLLADGRLVYHLFEYRA